MKMLHKIALLLMIFGTPLLFSSCSEDEDEDTLGDWVKDTSVPGSTRSGAIEFTIGNVAYVGLGIDADYDYLEDFYSYNVEEGFWSKETDFPGTLRERAVSFAIDGTGYVALGYNRDLDTEELSDVWKYDPGTKEWTQLKDFTESGGIPLYNCVDFVIGSNGYIGTGYDGSSWRSEFWQYDPAADSWHQISSYKGEKIEAGMAFVLNDKAYVCGGRNNGLYNNLFWEFDPTANTWTEIGPDDDESYYDEFYAAVRRHDAVALTLNNKAYIIGGRSSTSSLSSVYAYDASTQVWEEKTSFEGTARGLAVGFVLNGRIFYGTGGTGSSVYDDIWEFLPDAEYDEDQYR